MTATLRVAAVVLAHDGEATLGRVLEAVQRQTRPVDLLLVVDNGSADGSVAVAEASPGVVVVRTTHNLGVGGGHNLGWTEAVRRDPTVRCIWCLEHDTVPAVDCLERLSDAIDALGHGFIVRPRQVRSLDRVRDEPPPDRSRSAAQLTFNGLLLPVEAYEEVGGLDEGYFVGFEDRDFALRLHDAGWRIRRLDDAIVEHQNKGKRRHLTPAREYYSTRNQIHLQMRVRSAPVQATRLVARSALRLIADAVDGRRRREGFSRARWDGLRDGLRGVRGPRP